jgi:hypothetical protein
MNTQMVIRDMNPKDLDQVFEIEKSSFSSPWKKESFHHELFHNMYAHYLVLEVEEQVVGYCGIWIVMDRCPDHQHCRFTCISGPPFRRSSFESRDEALPDEKGGSAFFRGKGIESYCTKLIQKATALSREEFVKIIIPIMGKMHY